MEGCKKMSIEIKDILKEYVKGLTQIIGEDLKQVILYGSYARGEQAQKEEMSDIDIMILVQAHTDRIKEIEKQVLDYSYDLDLKYNILLSPIVENIDVYNNRIQYMTFYKNIRNEVILINE